MNFLKNNFKNILIIILIFLVVVFAFKSLNSNSNQLLKENKELKKQINIIENQRDSIYNQITTLKKEKIILVNNYNSHDEKIRLLNEELNLSKKMLIDMKFNLVFEKSKYDSLNKKIEFFENSLNDVETKDLLDSILKKINN